MSGERPESVVADRLQRARIQTSDACQVCLESVNCQIFHILQVTDSSQCFQQWKIWQMEMFSVARQRIKGPSHSHFNCFFLFLFCFKGLSPQSMLLITTELLNPVYLAANKNETWIMSKKKFTFCRRDWYPDCCLHTEFMFAAVWTPSTSHVGVLIFNVKHIMSETNIEAHQQGGTNPSPLPFWGKSSLN